MRELLLPIFHLMQSAAPLALIIGCTVVAAALVWLVLAESRRKPVKGAVPAVQSIAAPPRLAWYWWLGLALVITVAAGLRLDGLSSKTITHPEVYIPGIPLPDGISVPPPRLDLWRVVTWHFYFEPHPLGYYLAMFGWANLFGTSLTSLRLPAALLGILSIPVLFRIGTLSYNRTVGLIGAGLLALHGLHIFWSQQARMYVPECFFGLVATWLLLEILRAPRPRRLLEGAYVTAIVAGLSTEWFFWALAAAHILFTVLHYNEETGRMKRLLYFQVLAVVLGAYTLSHALVTLWSAGSGGDNSLEALRDYFIFGFFYEPDLISETPRLFPLWVVASALVVSSALLLRGLAVRPNPSITHDNWPMPAKTPLVLAAFGMTAFMGGLGLPSVSAIRSLAAISFVPLIALAAFPIARLVSPRSLERESSPRRPEWLSALFSPVVLSALFPVLLVFVASVAWRPMMVRRALLVFVPYLLLVLAAGAKEFGRRKFAAVTVTAVLLAFFFTGTWYYRTMPSSHRDYAGIAQAIKTRLQPGDVIFVPARQWWATPFFYYMESSVIVPRDFAAFVEQHPDARIWLLLLPESEPQNMLATLRGFDIKDTVAARGARAVLFSRGNSALSSAWKSEPE